MIAKFLLAVDGGIGCNFYGVLSLLLRCDGRVKRLPGSPGKEISIFVFDSTPIYAMVYIFQ
jgi:hypothetical protein